MSSWRRHGPLAACTVGVVAALMTGVLPGGTALASMLDSDAPVGTDAPYVAGRDLPQVGLHSTCDRVGAQAAFFTQRVVCVSGLDGATWEFLDPFLRLPREPAHSRCSQEGAFARDFSRPVVHRCTADDRGGLTWEPDPGWTRPTT